MKRFISSRSIIIGTGVIIACALGGCSGNGQVNEAEPIVHPAAPSTPKPKQKPVQISKPVKVKKSKKEKQIQAKHEHNLQLQKEQQRSHAQDKATGKNSLAYKLATIDNGYVETDDRSVKHFQNLLDQLSSKFVEDKLSISNITVKSHQMLGDAGISESCETIMENVNSALLAPMFAPDGTNHQKYAEYAALYVVDRKSGFSPEEYVHAVRTLIEG